MTSKLIVGFSIAIAIVALVVFIAFQSTTFNLRCDFVGPTGSRQQLAFHVEIPKFFRAPRITWVGENTHDLTTTRIDDTVIIANLATRLASWPEGADLMSFWFNRITGDAEIKYLHKPTEEDKIPAGYELDLDGFSQTGKCLKSEPTF